MRLFISAQVRLAGLLRRIYCRKEIIVFEKVLDGSAPVASTQIQYELRQVNGGNISDAVNMDSATLLNEFRELFKGGEKGFYVYHQDKVIHRSWVFIGPAKAPIFYNLMHYILKDGDALIHYCKTKKDFRNKGIYSSVLNEIGKQLYSGFGIKMLLIVAENNNSASIIGVKKVGFREKERRNIFNLMGFSIKS